MSETRTPPLAITEFRDQTEVEIRRLLIERNKNPDDPHVPITVEDGDEELAGAIFKWQQAENRVRAMLGIQATTPVWPQGSEFHEGY
ncbi:MAG: hypothetical protein HYU55_13150 [Nocardioides sp.]|nr:hypothetical protein [Nocardioides sp.]